MPGKGGYYVECVQRITEHDAHREKACHKDKLGAIDKVLRTLSMVLLWVKMPLMSAF
jgi:hypothetical protein